MKLELFSTISARDYPSLHAWDAKYRANFEFYQKQIDALAFHLQKSQRGWLFFGKWNYPSMYQKDLLELEILKKKQQLGSIEESGVQEYARLVQPDIKDHLNRTFSNKLHVPVLGIIGAGLAFAVSHLLNFQYSLRAGVCLVPFAADLGVFWNGTSAKMRTIEFLDFEIRRRQAQATCEFERKRVNGDLVQKFRRNCSEKSAEEYYEDVVQLAKRESGSWTEE